MAKLSDIIKPLDNTFNRDDDPLLKNNNSCIWIISGRRGAGKSTLLLSTLNSKLGYRKRFNHLYFVSPTARSDAKFKKMVKELTDSDKPQFYEQLDDNVMEEILSNIKSDNKEDDKTLSCIILDDCVLDIPKAKSSIFNKLIITSRHLRTTVIIISQKYNALMPIIRANADLISFFPSLNSREINTFRDDINIDKDVFDAIYNYCSTSSTDFMHVNLLAMPPKFFNKFDPIEFVPNEQ